MAIKKAASEEAAQYDSYVVVYLTVFIAFFAFSFKFPRSGLVQLVIHRLEVGIYLYMQISTYRCMNIYVDTFQAYTYRCFFGFPWLSFSSTCICISNGVPTILP